MPQRLISTSTQPRRYSRKPRRTRLLEYPKPCTAFVQHWLYWAGLPIWHSGPWDNPPAQAVWRIQNLTRVVNGYDCVHADRFWSGELIY